MKQFSDEFLHTFGGFTLEPRAAFKINNAQGVFWVTSHADIDTGAEPAFPYLTATDISTQKIDPEKGFSSLGGASFSLQDQDFTAALAAIDAAEDSLINNEVQFYLGYEGMALADYALMTTLLVDSVSNTRTTEYTITLKDRQRFIKRGIFEPKVTRLFAVVQGSDLVDLTTDQVMTQSNPGTLEVLDASELERVDHDANWSVDPNQKIGYIKIKGVDSAGNNTFEVFSYTGIDGNRLTGVVRQRFNTQAIAAAGSVSDGNTEVSEYVYLDLPVPKLIIAILTGELYEQPGETLPEHWHAGLTAADYELQAIEEIGDDLWEMPLDFRDYGAAEAKFFLGREVLRLCNLFFKVNQFGRLELRRFAPVLTEAPTVISFGNENIINFGGLRRDAGAIRNRFLINWEWRPELERFTRNSLYVDSASINRNNFTSDFLRLEFKGVRNRAREIVGSLNGLADGLRARFTDPAIRTTVTVPMQAGAAVEVGDIIGIEIPEWPDYVGVDGRLSAAFEVQAVRFNFRAQELTFELYSTSGRPSDESFSRSDVAVELDHTGWRRLDQYLDVATFNVTGNTLTITSDNTIQGQPDLRNSAAWYYWDGPVVINNGVTLFTTLNTLIDAESIELQGSGRISSKGFGRPGGAGGQNPSNLAGTGTAEYFGGGDLAEEGVCQDIRNSQWFQSGSSTNTIFRNGRQNSTGARRTQIESLNIRVNASGNLVGLPRTLMGNSGNGGQYSIRDITPKQYAQNRNNGTGFVAGGAGGASGGGLVLLFENLFLSPDAQIDTSGEDSSAGQSTGAGSSNTIWGGSGGPGYPGCLVALCKSRTSALPFLTNRHFGRVGEVQSPPSIDLRANERDIKLVTQSNINLGPWNRPILVNRGRDYSRECRLVKYIFGEVAHVPSPGVDPTGPAALPTAMQLTERVNVPRTPFGNVSTVTAAVTPPSDPSYAYAIFDYRAVGQDAWYPLDYKVGDQTTKDLPADGGAYEFSARSVSVTGQVSTARLVEAITLTRVTNDTNDSDTSDPDVQVPKVKRLELVNRINNAGGWNQWKGPNAEFRWGELSTTAAGSIVTPNGVVDLHLKHYLARIRRNNDGKLLREIETDTPRYTYTLEQNIKDTQGQPVRDGLRVSVRAVATTGYQSEPTEMVVSNPAPEAVTDIEVIYTPTEIEVSYTAPTDLDFVGVLARGKLRRGTSFVLTPMTARSETLQLVSVDQFGEGGTVNVALSNPAPAAPVVATSEVGFTSVSLKWINDTNDYDLIGTRVRFRQVGGPWSQPVLIEGNTLDLEGLLQGTNYQAELTAVDTLGDGGTTLVDWTTKKLDAADVEGLSPWATETDPVDLAFIQNNVANDSFPGEKIVGLTAAKLTAGQVVVQVDLGTGILLDGANGIIETINSGYSVIMGPVNRPSLSANPVVLHDWDGSDSTFWFDLAGNFSLGKGGITYDIGTDTTTFSGALNAASGTIEDITANNIEITGVSLFGDILENFILFDGTDLTIETPFFSATSSSVLFGDVLGNYVEFDGTDLTIETPFFSSDSSSVVFGDISSGDYIEFDGDSLNLGPNVTIGDTTNRTVTVGSTGDYPDLVSALNDLSKVLPSFKNGGISAIIEFQPGHEETDQITISGIDLGWITLKSQGDDLIVNTSTKLPFWMRGVDGATLPRIDTSITLLGSGVAVLFLLMTGSKLIFQERFSSPFLSFFGGSASSADVCIRAENGSAVIAPQLRIYDFDTGIRAVNMCKVDMPGAQVRTSDIAYWLERSEISLLSAIAFNASSNGIFSISSTIHAPNFQLTGTKPNTGINSSFSYVNVVNANFSGCSNFGGSFNAGHASVQGANFRKGGSNSSSDLRLAQGAIASCATMLGGCNITKNTPSGSGLWLRD